jgi:hypothetical protein
MPSQRRDGGEADRQSSDKGRVGIVTPYKYMTVVPTPLRLSVTQGSAPS